MSWTYRAGSFLSIGEKRNKNDDVKTFGGRVGCLTDIKNLEILKAAKSYEKSSFSLEKLLFRWQPKKDSNPHKQSQSLSCYHYTIRLYALGDRLATCIVYSRSGAVSSTFFRNPLFFAEWTVAAKQPPRPSHVPPSAARSFSSARFSMRDT